MTRRWHALRDDDRGLGVITVVFVMAVVTALAITAVSLTINNLDNSRRDRQALAALASSEAGVSQAIARLRTGSLAALTCMDPDAPVNPGAGCTTDANSWTNPDNPKQVRLDGSTGACTSSADCFRVWIGTLDKYVPNCAGRQMTPPQPCTGTYRIHATGISGEGPGARQLAVDVKVKPYTYPMGVFAKNFAGSGQVGVYRQSLFTTGCVQNRVKDNSNSSGVRFQWDSTATPPRPELDLIYNQPAAAHAVGEISTANNSCGSSGNAGPIHAAARCNTDFPYDQSGSGGNIDSTPCYGKYNGTYPLTSKLTDLEVRYGYREKGLTIDQYAALRSQADAQGTLNLSPSQIAGRLTTLAAESITSPVLYWDNGPVSLTESNFPDSFKRSLSANAACTSNSLTIVVEGDGNNLSYQGGNSGGSNPKYLVAAIFVPDATLTGTGGRQTIGTIFAETIDMSGNNGYYMDECFSNNPPGAIVDAEVVDWSEDDSVDFN